VVLIMPVDNLSGLGIVVTGGAGDIGRAIGAELTRRGARVRLLDVVDEPAVDLPYSRVDVRDRAALDDVLAGIDPLDVVIAGAGIVEAAPFLDLTEESWRRQLDVNLTGTFHTAQSAARLMVARGTAGRLIFVGSWVGEYPWPEDAAYSVSKAGIRMLARTAALELAPHGIRVNVVAPGIVDAGLAGRQLRTEPQYARHAAKAIPLGEFQTVEQVAAATAFLCGPDADYLTGSVLLTDGGCSLGPLP
jgi:NAD(P)-dependent dehydrogenase (short-subunit alcohol dehydrogenase family)